MQISGLNLRIVQRLQFWPCVITVYLYYSSAVDFHYDLLKADNILTIMLCLQDW